MANKINLMYDEFGKHPGDLTCKTCHHLIQYEGSRRWYKCSVYGESNSEATDWRLKYHACNAYDLPESEAKKYEVKNKVRRGRRIDDEPIPGQRTLSMLFCLILCLLLIGCASVIDTKTEIVEVKVIDEYYHAGWSQPIMVGKSWSYVWHPAEYEITVEYNGKEYTFNDEDFYEEHKDDVGKMIEMNWVTYYYDDDSTRSKLEIKEVSE